MLQKHFHLHKLVFAASLSLVLWGAESCTSAKQTTAAVSAPDLDTTSQVLENKGEQQTSVQQEPIDSIPVWAPKKGPYNPERTKKHDLLHTKLELRPDWQKQYMYGVATLTLKPYFYPQNTLQLDAKGFDIKSIELVDEKTKKRAALKYDYDNYRLNIQLDKTYTRNDKYTLVIDYTAKPNELPTGGSEAITSDKGLYFINADGTEPNKPKQIWTQGETESNSRWFPTIDSPNERCTEEIYLTVEQKYVTLSNGTLQYSKMNKDGTRTDYWKQDQPHAPYLFMIAVGEHTVVKDKWQNVEVNYYVEPAYAKYAKDIFGRTPEMIEFFSNKLNYKFPWDKYSQIIVRDFVSGAMENTTAVTFYEKVQMDDRELIDDNSDDIIAHELFHHWFGDLVTTESWANLPLNESFANYSEYLWFEHKLGADEADYHGQNEAEQYFAEAESKREPLIRYQYLDREDMFDSHSYAKGGRILHMLRKYVGDEAFFTALNLYLNKNKYSDVEIHNLRLAFEEVTGEDLNWFFNQWFLAAGHPDLAVSHTYENGKVYLDVTQRQDSAYTPIYRLPVKVDIWTNGQRTSHDVTITQAKQTIELPAAAKPDLVLFDSETQLLGKVEHPKTTEEQVFQFYNTSKYLARYEAFNGIFEVVKAQEEEKGSKAATADNRDRMFANPKLKQMAQDALNDKFWVIRQMAVRNLNAYQGEAAAEFEAKLKQMAATDPRSYVRAEAISTLASWKGNYSDLFEQALKDKSYSVVAAALNAYLGTKPADAAQKIAAFSTYKNTDVLLIIGNYYAEKREAGAYDWFASQMNHSDSPFLYQMAQLFGQYLISQPKEVQLQGVKVLEKMARQSTADYVRFSAFQTLALFAELEGVKEMRQDIKTKETSPRLKELYNMMP